LTNDMHVRPPVRSSLPKDEAAMSRTHMSDTLFKITRAFARS
jgi:hypothetical protein